VPRRNLPRRSEDVHLKQSKRSLLLRRKSVDAQPKLMTKQMPLPQRKPKVARRLLLRKMRKTRRPSKRTPRLPRSQVVQRKLLPKRRTRMKKSRKLKLRLPSPNAAGLKGLLQSLLLRRHCHKSGEWFILPDIERRVINGRQGPS